MTDHPDIRIGDRERLVVQDRLRDAYGQGALDAEELEERLDLALRARTQGDLVPLVADLPEPRDESLREPVGPAATPAARDDSPESRQPHDRRSFPAGLTVPLLIALAIAAVLGGLVEPPAIFGSRTITVGPDSADVRVVAIFGSVEVIAADDAGVNERVLAVFGSSECEGVCSTGDPDVTVTGMAIFGSVTITPPEGASTR